MKISIRNFGPIKSFDFDLKHDFVLIVGENNIGKSYAISLVYLILKTLGAPRRRNYYLPEFFDEINYEADALPSRAWMSELKSRFADEATPENVDITEHVQNDLKSVIERVFLRDLRESLYGTFNDIANLQNRYTLEPLELVLQEGSLSIYIGIKDDKLCVSKIDFGGHQYVARRVKASRYVKDAPDTTWIYYPTGKWDQFVKSYERVLFVTFGHVVRAIGSVSDLHYLPASRSGLYQALSAFGQIVAELAKNRTLLSRKLELPGISEPLSDYFLKLSDVRPASKHDGDVEFQKIAAQIEAEVLRGKVEFDSKTKRLMFKPADIDLQLDLSATSSMVSEISPIAAYLKYVLPRSEQMTRRRQQKKDGKQILIVEEPEAHLHPDVQVAIVKIFADMVRNTGVKIIMTSHSNYVFNKVSNLIISRSIDPEVFRAVLFRRGESGSESLDLPVGKFGVDDENFVSTAEDLYAEKIALIEAASGSGDV